MRVRLYMMDWFLWQLVQLLPFDSFNVGARRNIILSIPRNSFLGQIDIVLWIKPFNIFKMSKLFFSFILVKFKRFRITSGTLERRSLHIHLLAWKNSVYVYVPDTDFTISLICRKKNSFVLLTLIIQELEAWDSVRVYHNDSYLNVEQGLGYYWGNLNQFHPGNSRK